VSEKKPTDVPERAEPGPAGPTPAGAGEATPDAPPAGEAEVEVPLNRAARRGRAKQQQKPPPGHVGPQPGRTTSIRVPRSHTKRRSG